MKRLVCMATSSPRASALVPAMQSAGEGRAGAGVCVCVWLGPCRQYSLRGGARRRRAEAGRSGGWAAFAPFLARAVAPGCTTVSRFGACRGAGPSARTGAGTGLTRVVEHGKPGDRDVAAVGLGLVAQHAHDQLIGQGVQGVVMGDLPGGRDGKEGVVGGVVLAWARPWSGCECPAALGYPSTGAAAVAAPPPSPAAALTRMNWGIWSAVRLPGGVFMAHWQVGSLQVVGSHLYVSVAIRSAAGGSATRAGSEHAAQEGKWQHKPQNFHPLQDFNSRRQLRRRQDLARCALPQACCPPDSSLRASHLPQRWPKPAAAPGRAAWLKLLPVTEANCQKLVEPAGGAAAGGTRVKLLWQRCWHE